MDTQQNKIYDLIEVDSDYFSEHESEQEILYSRINILPTGVINILFGEDTPTILQGISSRNNLSQDQSANLSRTIRSILLADVFIGDLPIEISKQLGISIDVSKQIANDVASQLFQSELEDIKKVQNSKFPGRLPASSANKNPPQQTISQTPPRQTTNYQGYDLPESGGNLIDLRNKQ